MKLFALFSIFFLLFISLTTASTPRNARLLRRLQARQALLVTQSSQYTTANSFAKAAVQRLIAAQKACTEGDGAACSQKPELLRRAAVLRRSARKAAVEEEERMSRLRQVEQALVLARTYTGYVSTPPRYEHPTPTPQYEPHYKPHYEPNYQSKW